MSNEVFQYAHRVTYADCTIGNHVYYGRYLGILEAARGEFFRKVGGTFLQWQQAGLIFPVIECRLAYKAPANYDDVLTVTLWLTRLERVRLSFAYHLLDQNRVMIVEAETHHICASIEDKPRRLPESLVANLKPYLAIPLAVSS